MSTVWSGGERVGKSPVSGPAFRVNGDRPPSVIRRSGRRPAIASSLLRRILDAIDWGYVRFVIGYVATFAVLVHVSIGRAG